MSNACMLPPRIWLILPGGVPAVDTGHGPVPRKGDVVAFDEQPGAWRVAEVLHRYRHHHVAAYVILETDPHARDLRKETL